MAISYKHLPALIRVLFLLESVIILSRWYSGKILICCEVRDDGMLFLDPVNLPEVLRWSMRKVLMLVATAELEHFTVLTYGPSGLSRNGHKHILYVEL